MPACHSDVLFAGSLTTVLDAHCEEPRALQPGREEHASSHYLLFVRRGVFVRHHGRRALVAEPARVLLYNHQEPYRVSHPLAGGDDCTTMRFPADVIAEVAGTLDPAAADRPERPFALPEAPLSPAVLLRYQRLRRGLHAGTLPALAAEEEALGILRAVLEDAHAVRGDDRAARERPSTRRARRDLVERTRLALAHDPAADLSLAQLAREVASSPFHLARTFRAATGVPVHQYRLRVRLARALERLADERVSLSALAHELGFASHSHFTLAFRRLFGVAPSVVRAQLTGRRLRELRKNVAEVAQLAG